MAKGSVVGLIRSDTCNDALLLPEKYCGVDAKLGSWRWSGWERCVGRFRSARIWRCQNLT
eukprot:6841291-Ditylum_brightwellii.AAC.1